MTIASRRRVAAAAAAALLAGAVTTWVTDPGEPAPRGILAAAGRAPAGGASPTASVDTPTPSSTSPPAPLPAASPGAPLVASRSADPAPGDRDPQAKVPDWLTIAAIDAALDVSPVGVDERGAMALPDDPRRAGWYRFSARPGAPAGAVVIAAHVDSRHFGTGPLADMTALRAGDAVDVATTTGTARYVVTAVARLDKDSLDADALFDRGGPHRLHLVTCGGDFDARTGRYADNVVAVAYPAGAG